MTNSEYRAQWLKWQGSYERYAYRVFKRSLSESIATLNVDNVTYDNYKIVIPLNVQQRPIYNAYLLIYRKVGLTHGRRIGNGINREIKRFTYDLFSVKFLENLVEWVRENCSVQIVSTTNTVAKRIQRLVETALDQGLSVQKMQAYLRKRLNDPNFTKYQATRIARTVVGGAANHGAAVSADESGIVLDKVWISRKDKLTRRVPEDQFDHVQMDGVSVGQYDKFEVPSKLGTELLDHPCDPKGSAGDVINCRCAVAYRPRRDENGFVITR